MKNQALFSPKDKSKKLKCPRLQFLFGALRVEATHLTARPLAHNTCSNIAMYAVGFNPFQTSYPFCSIMQTVQTQLRYCRMQCFIMVYTFS